MSNYAQHFSPTQTPQSEKADPKQQPNSAGGFTFVVDCWTRLERFLILGSEGGSYYPARRVVDPQYQRGQRRYSPS